MARKSQKRAAEDSPQPALNQEKLFLQIRIPAKLCAIWQKASPLSHQLASAALPTAGPDNRLGWWNDPSSARVVGRMLWIIRRQLSSHQSSDSGPFARAFLTFPFALVSRWYKQCATPFVSLVIEELEFCKYSLFYCQNNYLFSQGTLPGSFNACYQYTVPSKYIPEVTSNVLP
ncbi:hypothetical protein BDN72DRAFT_862146 [Pluteus cervinus]|uniref:Uncharacterized protein n=1 Tax=Pluteus cervinus TaxID=181527 RepID=A0ACD3ACD7_9AGAR|nr:hypothetical protein BDN72DRAFT_862146 [Pluteus cervinus]